MLALIFGIVYVTLIVVSAMRCTLSRLDRINVGDSDADGDRRQQHEHNHQDYFHSTGLVRVEGLELLFAASVSTQVSISDAQCCMINVPGPCMI